MTDKAPRVTINLLTWNGAQYLPLLLRSLQEQTFRDWELLVLDNASYDNSVAVVEEYFPPATIIKQKQNVGFAKGHNLLIKWSKSDYVLVLNQDVILEPDYLKILVKFMDAHPQVASCSGKILYWDFPESKKTNKVDSYGLRVGRNRQVVDWRQSEEDSIAENQEVFGLSAVAVLYRREALENVKMPRDNNDYEYFDEDFFSYKEDIDLAWRLRLWTWENWLVASTKAYHHRTVSGRQGLKERRQYRGLANKLSYRNHWYLLYKNSCFSNELRDWRQILWYEFKKIIYLLIWERPTLVGIKEFFKYLPKMARKRRYIRKHCRLRPAEIYPWFRL